MKKLVLVLVMAFSVMALSAQVMGSNGVKNTVWSGFGTPDSDNQDNEETDDTEPQNTTDTDDRQEKAIELPFVPAK